MNLTILTIFLCMAHLSAASCPTIISRPDKAKSCLKLKDCPKGQSCCSFSDHKICVKSSHTTCHSEGKILKNGQSVILKDNCTICQCQSAAGTVCNSKYCKGSKPTTGNCPFIKPSSANKSCSQSTKCSSGYKCCEYNNFQDSYCTLADPSKCKFKGKSVSVGKTVTKGDHCTECKCFGHDNFICTDEPCFLRSRKGCNYGGELRDPGSRFPSTDGCNKCWCSSGKVKCTRKICIKNPFFDKRKVYKMSPTKRTPTRRVNV